MMRCYSIDSRKNKGRNKIKVVYRLVEKKIKQTHKGLLNCNGNLCKLLVRLIRFVLLYREPLRLCAPDMC